MLLLAFKKPAQLSFGVTLKNYKDQKIFSEEYPQLSEKAINILSLSQLYACVMLNFLHSLQPEQHDSTV